MDRGTAKRNSGEKKLHTTGFFFLAVILLVAALFVGLFTVGYDFTAVAMAGAGLYLIVYGIVNRLCITWRIGRAAFILRRLLQLMLLAGLVVFASIEFVIVSAAHTDANAGGQRYAIVLGAGLHGDVISLALAERLGAALTYLEQNPDTVAIVSGGQGEGEWMTEASDMRAYLEQHGIASDRIIEEPNSTSTEESIAFSREIIAELNEGDTSAKVAVITSEYHLYRAKYLAEKYGLDPVGVAAHTSLFFLKLNYFAREVFSLIKVVLLG